MNRINFLLAILSLAMIIGCNKFPEPDPGNGNNNTNTYETLSIASDFKFKSSQKLTLNLSVTPHIVNEAPHIFKIYQGAPGRGGKLLAQGMTDENYDYSVSFVVADRIDSIFIENKNANGIYELVGKKVNGTTINHEFNTNTLLNGMANTKSTYDDPGCGSDCDVNISGIHTTLLLDKDDYCVAPGSSLTITGQLELQNRATLVICGEASINEFTLIDQKPVKIYISETGKLTIPGDLTITTKHLHIYNFGELDIVGNLTTFKGQRFYNYELLSIGGNYLSYSDKFQNEGIINITGNFSYLDKSRCKNYGTINVSGDATFSSKSIFYNYCKLQVENDLTVNQQFRNYSYVKVENDLIVSDDMRYFSYNGSLTETKNLTSDGDIRSGGTGYSKINIRQTTILNAGSKVSNKMDLCDSDGVIETNEAQISNNVVYCETTIPESGCNPGSEGGTGTIDTDGDNVPDVDDEFPDNADFAFVSYYPNQDDFATLAFEDLWPGRGDYDFNDLVLDIQYKIITNAQNKIVQIEAKTHVRAAGATLDNGFGVSFPTSSANCEQVTGYRHQKNNLDINAKGFENGHNGETVVIFYDAINTIYGANIINTEYTRPYVETDTLTVIITFSNPEMSLGNEPYNPFIYINQERGKEVHLIDNKPTDKVDDSFFGISHDNSIPSQGRYYVTNNNLPWAIIIPASLDYAIEKADVLSTHLKFEEWATSSGSLFNDWYLDKPGYRESENIYSKPD